jgi:hypothetical protein
MKLDQLLTRSDLSWKAKGIAAFIALKAGELEEPGTNKINTLLDNGVEMEASVRSGLRELEAAGILTMRRLRNQERSGQVTGSTWEIDVEWL